MSRSNPAITETYREIDKLSASALKTWDEDITKFYDRYVLKSGKEDIPSDEILIGNLVDFYVLECYSDETIFSQRFDEKFCLSSVQKGKKQVFLLADELFSLYINDNNTSQFSDLFEAAAKNVQAKGKYSGKTIEQILTDFETTGQEYYDSLLTTIGKNLVEQHMIDKAIRIGNQLYTDDFTKDLFITNREAVNHFVIEWKYKNNLGEEVEMKSELDRVLIDHSNKIISIYDIKATYDNTRFKYNYLKMKYYLPATCYWFAAHEHFILSGLYPDYKVEPMQFIVCDTSKNNRRPLIYRTFEEDVLAGLNGFLFRGTFYRGIEKIINEIAWAKKNDIWDVTEYAIKRNGVIPLTYNYEIYED